MYTFTNYTTRFAAVAAIVCLLLINSFGVTAQVFFSYNGAFTNTPVAQPYISGGTQLAAGNGASMDDAIYTNQLLGFQFNFTGNVFNSVGVSSNGFIWFGSSVQSATNYTPISSATMYTGGGAVSAFGADLEGQSAASEIRTLQNGTAHNHTFTVQWKNVMVKGSAVTDTIDLWITLHECTNTIEIAVASARTTWTGSVSGQVGLRGVTNTDYLNIQVDGSTHPTWASATSFLGNNASICEIQKPNLLPGINSTHNARQIAFAPTLFFNDKTASNCNWVSPQDFHIVNAGGGIPPYTVSWTCKGVNDPYPSSGSSSNFTFPADIYIDFVAGGTPVFSISVTDASGCPVEIGSFSPTLVTCGPKTGVDSTPPYLCPCGTGRIKYTATSIQPGNVFTVELSDANGGWGSPVTIGTMPGTASTGYIPITIPCNTPPGNHYRIRVATSNQATPTGEMRDNEFDISIGLSGPFIVSEIHNDAACGHNNGSISLIDSLGSAPFTYNWSNGATTLSLDSLTAGIYGVTVEDALGCVTNKTIIISNTNGPSISETHSDVTCLNGGGDIHLVVTSGRAPFAYLWSNGATTPDINSLAAGTYTVTVTDNDTCAGYAIISIAQKNEPNYYVYVSGTPSNCHNHTGTVAAAPFGGTPPYSYLWNNNETTQTISGVGGGTYYVTATDSLGCTRTGFSIVDSICVHIITGRIFKDVNNNCIFDSTDYPLPANRVSASNGTQTYYGTSDNNGYYTIYVYSDGMFNLTSPNYYYYPCFYNFQCPYLTTVTFNSGTDTTIVNDFALETSSGFDLTLHPGWTSAYPGGLKEMWIYYYNQSGEPFSGKATITLKYDSTLVYQSSLPPLPVHDSIAHTLTWLVNVVPSYTWNQRLINFFQVPSSLPLNYNLQSDFYITPTLGDCDSSNNHLHFSENVTGSHDPNAKEVSPSGGITEKDSVLTYTIHFQNTGNDTANFIIVKDTLSPYLNPGTVVNLASSNNYEQFSVSGQSILTWLFNPIYLVDSNTNVAGSKGFITFSVKKNSGLPGGTVIKNRASIYFDYNAPVFTNTVSNTVEEPLAVKSTELNIKNFKVYPNPSDGNITIATQGTESIKEIIITNTLGQVMARVVPSAANDKTMQLQLPYASGLYFIHLRGEQGEYVNKVVVN